MIVRAMPVSSSKRHGAGQRTGLEHQDHFVAVGRQADARGTRQDDVEASLSALDMPSARAASISPGGIA
jgi:hypothetical protein